MLSRKLRDTLYPERLDARLDDEFRFHFEQKAPHLASAAARTSCGDGMPRRAKRIVPSGPTR